MSNIHVLPVGHLSHEQARRLIDDLSEAHANGSDLGSRSPHIRAAAEAFRQLAADLRGAVEGLAANTSAGDRIDAHAIAALRLYIEGVEQLATMAASFPDLDPDPETGDPSDLRADPVSALSGSTAAQ